MSRRVRRVSQTLKICGLFKSQCSDAFLFENLVLRLYDNPCKQASRYSHLLKSLNRWLIITSSRLWASSHRPDLYNHWPVGLSSHQGDKSSMEIIGRIHFTVHPAPLWYNLPGSAWRSVVTIWTLWLWAVPLIRDSDVSSGWDAPRLPWASGLVNIPGPALCARMSWFWKL